MVKMNNEWHKKQQSYFDNKEVSIAKYRADAVYDKFAFEFQDKHIMTKDDIDDKNEAYEDNGYTPVWILNMNNRMMITIKHDIKCNGFIDDYKDCENLFLSYNDQIIFYKNSRAMDEDAFYKYIKEYHALPSDSCYEIPKVIRYPFELKYIQYGAGGGKTYGIVEDTVKQMESVEGFNVIILTKVHTAKSEIRKKLLEDFKRESLIDKSSKNGKYYEFRLNSGCLVIATVDSFLYNVLDKKYLSNTHSQQMFNALAKSLKDENKLSANILFKTIPIIKSRIYIDEAQDLHKDYFYLIRAVSKLYGTEFILVGDIFQSIYDVHNLYYCIINRLYEESYNVIRLKPNMKYICYRFRNIFLALHHNKEFYHNAEFIQYCKNMGLIDLWQLIETEGVNFNSNCELDDEYILGDPIEHIDICDPESTLVAIRSQILNEDKYQELEDTIIKIFESVPSSNPQDWCIICPFMKKNLAAHQVVNTANEYWHKKFPDIDKNTMICKLYSSENGEPIKIEDDDRKHKTLIMTIHASKGQTFNYVICLGCQYEYIKIYPQCYCSKNNLFYISMINVAWTRASHRMFIVNYKLDSRNLRYRQPYDGDFDASDERVVSILNKINWYKDYEDIYKLNDQIASSNHVLIDNNYQTLRYHIITSLMKFRLSYVHGSSSLYAKIVDYAKGGFIFCKTTKEFMHAAKEFVNRGAKDPPKPMPLYDYSEYYPNAMNCIRYVCHLYSELSKNINFDSISKFKEKIYKSGEKDISRLLVWGYMMFQQNGNIYKQNDYQTLCEVLELIRKPNDEIYRYVDVVTKHIDQEYTKFRKTQKIGFSNISHPFIWSMRKPHTIYGPSIFMIPLLNVDKECRKLYFGDMDEKVDYVILNPTNSELNFINFDSEVLRALLAFVCIKAETNQEKKLILVVPSKNTDEMIIEFDFRDQIDKDDYEYLLEYIKKTCLDVNKELGNRISDAILDRISISSLSPKDLCQILLCMISDEKLKTDDFTNKVLEALINNIEDWALQSYKIEDIKTFIRDNVPRKIESIITKAIPSNVLLTTS